MKERTGKRMREKKKKRIRGKIQKKGKEEGGRGGKGKGRERARKVRRWKLEVMSMGGSDEGSSQIPTQNNRSSIPLVQLT